MNSAEMATTGQTINDRLNAVRYALAGQGLARTVCKATTEEVLAPKKKHIVYLLACTEEPNVSIPQLANLLIDRTQNASWAVVFKSLITIHHLLNFCNERFTQYLATSNHSFELNDFMDRTTPQGYNMSTFVRRYAKYINDKISSYKSLAIDLCKVKPGKDNALRTMNMENLTKTLPVVHTQFDSLLDFNTEAKDVNNGIIMAAFKLLYKDLNRIFAAYQEAIINLVERYFNLSRKKAREALNMYKKYLARMDKVANFFKVVEQVGLDKSEMPDTSKLTSLLAVFETHLGQLEAKKRGTTSSSPPGELAEGDTKPESSIDKENSPPKQEQASSSREVANVAPAKEKTSPQSDVKQPEAPAKMSESQTRPATSAPVKKQPPARPSPIVSPKVSPSEPKPATSSSADPAGSGIEKKGPAKPPSRPPPPSATTPTTSAQPASGAAVASRSSSPPQQASPPPHPPPPHPQPPACPPAARATSPAVSAPSRASPTDPVESSANTSVVSAHDDNGSSEMSHVGEPARVVDGNSASDQNTTTDPPACGGSNAPTEATSQQLDQQPETNHISTNNESNHVQALPDDLPPPPIDDTSQPDEALTTMEGGNGVAEETVRQQHQPDNNDAEEPEELQELPPPPPPPPPPPIEE